MIRIDLYLHWAGKFHRILTIVCRDDLMEFVLKVGAQKTRFVLLEDKDGGIIANRYVVLIAVDQAQAVDGGRVPVAVVVVKKVVLVSTCTAVIRAPAIAAPEGSTTRPVNVALFN